MTNENLQLLANFRSEVSPPDEATAQRISRLATTERNSFAPRMPHPPFRLPQLARRRRLIALSAGAAAALSVTGLLVALTLSGAAPESAYAAARKAVAATSAGALDSGTMTLTSTGPISRSSTSMVTTVRWNGDDLAIESGGDGQVLPGFAQLLLVGGSVYLQRPDGSWLHYASEADLEPPLYGGAVRTARSLAAGSGAAQIIASAYDLKRAVQPDGSTVYRGTISPSHPAEAAPENDTANQFMLPVFGPGGAFEMIVGSDGLVTQMSETASPPLAAAWSIEYSLLGSTSRITPPATYAEGTPGDLPTPPQQVPTDTAP